MREQCDPPTGAQIRIKVNPTGPRYYYKIDGHLSAAHYTDARSALADARRRQYVYPDGRIEPAERVLFVLAMQVLGISGCQKEGERHARLRPGIVHSKRREIETLVAECRKDPSADVWAIFQRVIGGLPDSEHGDTWRVLHGT